MSAGGAPPWIDAAAVDGLSERLGEPAELAARRRDAHRLFLELPLEPDPLYRQYGYFSQVDLHGITPSATGPAVALPPPLPGAIRVVHDGAGTRAELPSELSKAGVTLRPIDETEGRAALLGEGERPTDRLSALSVALANRGYALDLPSRLKAPVRLEDLTILSQPHEALSVRRAVRVGDGTQLLVTEELYGKDPVPAGQRFVASSVKLELGARSKVVYLGLHAPDANTVSFYQRSATSGPASRLAWIWAGLGGLSTRARNRTTLAGHGSAVDDLQTFYGRGRQAYDSDVRMTHTGEGTHGQSITRGVFRDEARGMSRGLVRIEREARKTVSLISEHAMLLDRGARSDTIPILEILCRDVKATHSTSVAPIDPEKIFYLESRGTSEADAIRAIGEGFLSYVFERAPIEGLREALYPYLAARWEGRSLAWSADDPRALPTLTVSGTEAAPEWRFDAKLN